MVSFLALDLHLHLQARHITVTTTIADIRTMARATEFRALHIDFHQEAEAEAVAELHHHRALKAHLAILTTASVGCLLRRLHPEPAVLPRSANGSGAWQPGAG